MMMKQAVAGKSILSVENADKTEEKPSIWASILCDVKSSTRKVPATKSLVVLGDNESGRTTLVAKLQGNDDPKRGAGLEYHYIDIKDDDRDDTPKLGVWILDGNVACSAPLLKFAIKSETIENTMLILVASMTQPWSLLSTLTKWTALIEEHVARLKIDPTRLREMHDHLQYDFQHYIEPNDAPVDLVPPTTIQNAISGGHISKPISSISLASATLSSSINSDEQVVLPLADGILRKSFGIPIIIIITKCDAMSTLEKENDYNERYFEFLQYHIRKFCLEYGAALFYTSVKAKKNIDKLYKYIVHKCYGYPFTLTAAIDERDAIFIPAGWDNPKKVDILLENLHQFQSTDNYTDIFVNPADKRPPKRDDEIIMAEDDQEFLSKLQLTLNRTASPTTTDENATPMHTRTSGTSAAGNSQTSSATGRSRTQQVKIIFLMGFLDDTTIHILQSVTPGAGSNEGALANFFNSLINKKSAGAVTPTGVSTSVAQRPTSQSPTTPTSKRLQQHPLTFAVTPPPGRTRTPTSHKIFLPSLNTESLPKTLSPVVEKQWLTEDTSASSQTVVGIPLEDSVSMQTFDTTENQQTEISTIEPLDLLHNEQPFNSAAQYEKESITDIDKQNKQSLVSQENSLSIARDSNKAETNISFSESSPITNENSITNQILPNDETNEALSNDVSLSQIGTQDQGHEIQESPVVKVSIPEVLESNEPASNNSLAGTELRSTFLSQSDEFSNGEYLNDTSSTSESVLTFPIATHETHELLKDAELKSPQFSSNHMFENTPRLNDEGDIEQQLYPTKSKDEAIKLHDRNSPSNNDEEQLASGRRSLNSSCQNSAIDTSYPLASSNPALNELNEQQDLRILSPAATIQTPIDDNLLCRSSVNELLDETVHPEHASKGSQLSDIHQAMLPIQPRSTSSSKLEPSETSTFFQEANLESSSLIQQTDHGNISTDEVLSTDQYSKVFSTSGDDIVEQEHPDQIFISHDSMNKKDNSLDSTVQMTPEHIDLPNTKHDISPTTIDEETLLESITSEQQFLPAANNQQANSQRIDDILLQKASNGKLLATESMPLSSGSVEFIGESEPDESDTQFNVSHNETEVPIDDEEQDTDRTSTLHFQGEERKSPLLSSPIEEEIHQRSRSQSTTSKNENAINQSLTSAIEEAKQNNQGSQPPSSIMQDEESSRLSPVPILTEKEHDNRTSSPDTEVQQETTLSMWSEFEEEEKNEHLAAIDRQQKRSPSLSSVAQENIFDSPSPIHEEVQQRSKSQSLFTTNEHQNNQSFSPTTQELEQNGVISSSELHKEDPNNQSQHFLAEQHDRRDRPSSPAVEGQKSRSQSPSPFLKDKQLSQSPMSGSEYDAEQTSEYIGDKENNDRSRPLSPASEDIRQRSSSQTGIITENHNRSRTSSLYSESKNEQSRTTSPCIEKEEWARTLESPTFDTKARIIKSSSPVLEVSDEGKASTSIEPNDKRDQSPSSITEELQEKSSPSLGSLEYEHKASRSSDHVEETNEETSSSAFENEEPGGIPSASSVSKIKNDESRIFSFIAHDDEQRNESSLSVADEPEEANSLFVVEPKRDRSHSSSSITAEVPQRSSSPLDDIESDQKFSRSSSITSEPKNERNQCLSPTVHKIAQRRSSSSISTEHPQQQSRSPTFGEHEQADTISSSVMEPNCDETQLLMDNTEALLQPSSSLSHVFADTQQTKPSSTTHEDEQIATSTFNALEQTQHQSVSVSPLVAKLTPTNSLSGIKETDDSTKHPSSVSEDVQQTSLSVSPLVAKLTPTNSLSGIKETDDSTKHPSSVSEDVQQTSLSPVNTHQNRRLGEQSSSPVPEPRHQRSQSSSPGLEREEQRTRSPSPVHGSMHDTGRSISPHRETVYGRSRSPSRVNEPIHERSRSSSRSLRQEGHRSSSPSRNSLLVEQESRSSSPPDGSIHEISRSSSLFQESLHERSRSPSPAPEPLHGRSRSPSPIHDPMHEKGRSSSPLRGPLHERSRSPSLSLRNEEHRKSSGSGFVEEGCWMKQSPSRPGENVKEASSLPAPYKMTNQIESPASDDDVVVKRILSSSPEYIERQLSNGSVSPVTEEQHDRNGSVLRVGGSAKQKSGSSSPSMEQELVRRISQSSAVDKYHDDQTKRFSSDTEIRKQFDSAEKISSVSEKGDLNEPESKSSNEVQSLPINYDEQEIEYDMLTSVIAENRQRDSPVKTDDDTINYGALKISRSRSGLSEHLIKNNNLQSGSDVIYETAHKLNEIEIISQMVQLQEEDHDQASSLIVSGKVDDKYQNDLRSSTRFTFADDNTEQSEENRHVLVDKNGPLKEFSYPSPLMEEPLLVLSPIPEYPLVEEQQETPSNNTRKENQQSRLVSPSVVLDTENHTSLANTSLVHEYVLTTTLDEKESTTSPTRGIEQKLSNDSSALIDSKPLETVETISLEQSLPADHHIELNTSTNPLPSDNRLSTIIRSQNSSTIARPNSLPFSPNDHDLDGLYISNDYNDECEVAENNEYHHSSGPSTTNVEYHHSSLQLKNTVEEQNAPTDANDTGKTQSIVEKSKIEDNDNNGIDSTNSKRNSN
ncbi:unnamed protein product [Rotaria magnacalcarata]|uniref:Dynein light intermediate chain n=5 Tax=Rotaria magnacalcarata TaxID=392030 RepID=A0A816DAI2_9BILA|nr:unnamed protein product [Rotaria magnacalcarata]